MPETLQKYLTTPEVATILRKSIAWAERARWAGDGPPFRKIGRTILYPEAELHSWIEAHTLKTSTSQDCNMNNPGTGPINGFPSTSTLTPMSRKKRNGGVK